MSLSAADRANIEEEIKQARQIVDQLAIAGLVQDLERLSAGTIEALARTVDVNRIGQPVTLKELPNSL